MRSEILARTYCLFLKPPEVSLQCQVLSLLALAVGMWSKNGEEQNLWACSSRQVFGKSQIDIVYLNPFFLLQYYFLILNVYVLGSKRGSGLLISSMNLCLISDLWGMSEFGSANVYYGLSFSVSLPLVFANYLYPGYWRAPHIPHMPLWGENHPWLPSSDHSLQEKIRSKQMIYNFPLFFSLLLFSLFQTFCSRSHSKHWSFLVLLCGDVWALQPLLCVCVSDQRLLLHHPLSHKAKVSGWTCCFLVHRAVCSFTGALQTGGICCQVYAILAQGTLPLTCLRCQWP